MLEIENVGAHSVRPLFWYFGGICGRPMVVPTMFYSYLYGYPRAHTVRPYTTATNLYSALQQNIHKCLYKFQITASNFLTIRKYAFKSFPCSLKFLRRIFCIFCYSAEYNNSERKQNISLAESKRACERSVYVVKLTSS